jgi:hypothetical protein
MSERPDISDKPPYFGAPGFSDSYWIELLYNEPPRLNVDELMNRLRAQTPVEVMAKRDDKSSGIISIGHLDQLVNFESDGKLVKMPSMTNIVWTYARISLPDYKSALDQTWDWEDCKKVLGRCWYKVTVGDITGSRLPYAKRLGLLTAVATACVEVTNPLVCHWKGAGCLVQPSRLGERMSKASNVRLFNVGIGTEHLMDTLGLAAIGLPDVQCAFSNLDPSWVAGWMYGVATYLFERGDVINDGDVIPAPVAGEHWTCTHEVSRVPPSRTVLNVKPSPAHAASQAIRQ